MLSRHTLERLVRTGELVVDPLLSDTIRENGLDLHLGGQYCLIMRSSRPLDPRDPGDPWERYNCWEAPELVVQPGRRYLLHTLEYIRLPSYLAGLVNLRSTWARLGLFIPPTVVDAGFEGQLTIELVGSEFPVKLRAGDRLLHLVLVRLDAPTTPYRGDYQGQRGVRLPKIWGGTWCPS